MASSWCRQPSSGHERASLGSPRTMARGVREANDAADRLDAYQGRVYLQESVPYDENRHVSG